MVRHPGVTGKGEAMKTRVGFFAVALGLIAGAALLSAPADAKDRVKYRPNPSAWFWFGPPGRGEHIALKARVEQRGFYIGPHYRSNIAPGYHTNGPGIGIMR
jgi:hypothetical protein